MTKTITTNARLVTNSLDDGTVKIKMATVGVKNLNGLTIKAADTIKYNDKAEYPLFFEHQRDMNNLIGTFTPKGTDGDDIMAEATITEPKALALVKSGALHSASITYVINDYVYDEEDDNLIVSDAYLVELSLVLDPADPTAQIMNARQVANQLEDGKEENAVTDEQIQTLIDAIDADTKQVVDALSALTEAVTGAAPDDGSDAGDDADTAAENARKAKALADLKGKWA